MSFLNASLGKNPTYAWRAFFSARDLLQQGHVWRVGNGASINIWGDRWIPTPITYTTIFNPEEARVIASIPLGPNLPPDHLIWLGTKNENFL
jgi:hypothetical protein